MEIIFGVIGLLALIGIMVAIYERGYRNGLSIAWEEFEATRIEDDLADFEDRVNFNANYEELPSLMRKQAE